MKRALKWSLKGAWELSQCSVDDVSVYECQPLTERARFTHIWHFVTRAVREPHCASVTIHCATVAHARRLHNSAHVRPGFVARISGTRVTMQRVQRVQRSIWTEILACEDPTRFHELLRQAAPESYDAVKRLSMDEIKEVYSRHYRRDE